MAEIQVEVRPGEFAPFEIKGEKPNYVEMKQIQKLLKKKKMYLVDMDLEKATTFVIVVAILP